MSGIGDMPMPAGFRYKKVYARGRPRHGRTDAFLIRHPRMSVKKRAKIFAPFDALRGFNAAVIAKNELYEPRKDLCPEDRAELDRRMAILLALAGSLRLARRNQVRIRVCCYVLCSDVNHEAFGVLGQYRTLEGLCRLADPVARTLTVEDARISFDDILRLESDDGLFDEGPPDSFPSEDKSV